MSSQFFAAARQKLGRDVTHWTPIDDWGSQAIRHVNLGQSLVPLKHSNCLVHNYETFSGRTRCGS